MNPSAEFAAAMPEPHTILGLRLRPLSLGRYRLLKRFQCPFVEDASKNLDIKPLNDDLFFSLLICGLSVRELDFLLSYPKKLAKEARRFGRVAKKYTRQKGFNILEHFASFKRYLNEGSAIPWVVLTRQDNGEKTMAHWSTSIEVTLRSKVGWTQEEIEEQPLTKALADFFKYMESEGMVKLYDPEVYQSVQGQAKANGDALEKIMKDRR